MSNEPSASNSAMLDRQIRVFISSTFRDMQAERDYLVKYIFPELRRLCESRGVTWGEVDLRWGVTDEAVAEGKVLPICLEEIRRCRPYFIGLLGERYGWIPDPNAISDDLLDREPWLKEHLHGRKSVTELEIIHGVLRDQEMRGHGYFYFRDPRFSESVPKDKRLEFTAENAKSAEKLQQLKDRIRHARDAQVCRLREDYHAPQELGDWIREDFTGLINELFPEGSEPEPLDREAMDHDAYARSREGVYIGRPEYFARLDAHASGGGDQPLVILGESGSGKSALLANWLAGYRREHPDVLVLQHYIGATPYSADWAAMLRRLMGEFKRRLGIQQDIPDKSDALRSVFSNWLHMAAAKLGVSQPRATSFWRRLFRRQKSGLKYGRVVLALDALNQIEDRDGAPDLVWLPPAMPENVRLVVSTLPGRPLDEIKKRRWPEMTVVPLEVDERKDLIARYLAQSAKHLSLAQLARIADAPQSANPLYLRVLLDELRVFGKHEELDQRIGHYLQAESLRDLYRKVISRWEEDYGAGTALVRDTLSLLWAARRGLSETELLGTLGCDGKPLPRAVWSPLFLAMSDALISRGGLLTFAHDFFRAAARDVCVPDESAQQKAHLRLADYFQSQSVTLRRTNELPWQLAEAKAWDSLTILVSDMSFLSAAWRVSRLDVKRYWTELEAHSKSRMLKAYAGVLKEPSSYVGFLSDLAVLFREAGHLVEAGALGHWYVEHCRSTGDMKALQAALGELATTLEDQGQLDHALEALEQEEQICRKLGHSLGLAAAFGDQGNIFMKIGDAQRALALHKEQERIARMLGDDRLLALSIGNQACILHRLGKPHEALKLHHEEEHILRKQGDMWGLRRSLCNHGLVLIQALGELESGLALLKEQETICRNAGDQKGLSASLCNQALAMMSRGDSESALTALREAEQMCRAMDDNWQLVNILGNKAILLSGHGDYEGSWVLLSEAEHLCRATGNIWALAAVIANQVPILMSRGDLDGAMTLCKEQERICRQLGNLDGLSISLGNQAVILDARGDLDGAMALDKEVERICRQLGNLDGLQATLGNQGLILQARGDLDGAMALHKEKEQICRQLGNLDSLSISLGNQALILQDRGDLDGAMTLHKEAERICRQLGNPNGLQTSLGNQALILKDRGDLDGAMALHKEKERICRQLGSVEGLATSLANQADILQKTGRAREGLPLAEEAYRLATSHGYTALVGKFEPILQSVRKAAAGN